MNRSLYSFFYYLLVPVIVLRLLWRSIKEPLYRQDLLQRFGFVPIFPAKSSAANRTPVIWVHGVSAGETTAAGPLVELLTDRGFHVRLTTMTATGRERAIGLSKASPEKVTHSYVPYDLPGALKRFVKRVQPSCLVVIDTELWPNMIHQCHEHHIPVVLVNGRLSARSAAGYQRIVGITRPMLDELTFAAVQTPAHASRFEALGLAKNKMSVTGSIKFDQQLPTNFDETVAQIKELMPDRFVIVAGSTHAGEEAMIVEACQSLKQAGHNLLLVIAPRHPNRFDEVATLLKQKIPGRNSVQRYSEATACAEETTVLLLDTMGVLNYFYGAADLAIVGGSLVPAGGHNFLEAVSAGAPVVMGSFLENIEDIAAVFVASDAMVVVNSATELTQVLEGLVSSASQRARLTNHASEILEQNRGALQKVTEKILALPF